MWSQNYSRRASVRVPGVVQEHEKILEARQKLYFTLLTNPGRSWPLSKGRCMAAEHAGTYQFEAEPTGGDDGSGALPAADRRGAARTGRVNHCESRGLARILGTRQ